LFGSLFWFKVFCFACSYYESELSLFVEFHVLYLVHCFTFMFMASVFPICSFFSSTIFFGIVISYVSFPLVLSFAVNVSLCSSMFFIVLLSRQC